MNNRLDALIYKAAAEKAFIEGAGTSTSDVVNEIKTAIYEETDMKPKGLTLVLMNKNQLDTVQASSIINILQRYKPDITFDQLMVNAAPVKAKKYKMTA